MRNKILVLSLMLAMLLGMGIGNRAEARATISLNVFFDALAPHGNWISSPDYGYAWYPHQASTGWRPYSYGHWSWSDYGWTWVSDEPWGWATYHYGRWVLDDYYGWVWLPGTVWAPAWVTWFNGPGYIGWAPLAPDYDFFRSDYAYYGHYGLRHKYRHHHRYQPSHCIFVPLQHFLHRRIHSVAVNPSRNVTIIKNTKHVTNIKLVNNRVVNHGPDVGLIEKSTRSKIRKINVVDRDLTAIKGKAKVNNLEGREYRVFRPKIVKERNETVVKERDAKNSPTKVEKKDRYITPEYKKSIRKKESIPSQPQFKEREDLKYRIGPADRNGSVQTRKKEHGLPGEYQSKKPMDRGYSVKSGNKKRSTVGANNRLTDKVDTHSVRGYATPKRGVVKTGSLVDNKGMNRSSYSRPDGRGSGNRGKGAYEKANNGDSRTGLSYDRKAGDLEYQ